MVARSEQVDDSPKNYFCRDPTSRRRSSDSASHANSMEFTTGTPIEPVSVRPFNAKEAWIEILVRAELPAQ